MNILKYSLECSSLQIICSFLLQYVWWRNVAWLFLRCGLLFANVLLVSSLETVKLIFQLVLLWNILVLYFVWPTKLRQYLHFLAMVSFG